MAQLIRSERIKRLNVFGINEEDLSSLAELERFCKVELPDLLPAWNERFVEWPELYHSLSSVHLQNARLRHWQRVASGQLGDGFGTSAQELAKAFIAEGVPSYAVAVCHSTIVEGICRHLGLTKYTWMDRVSPSRANRKGRKVLLLQRVAWFALELILENYSNAEKKLKREVVSDIAGEIDTTLSMIVADIKKAVSSFEDVVSDLAKSASKSALSSKTAAGVAAQVASSLTQVADAARELDAAMAEVALQTEHSRNVVAEAVGIAGDVSATMAVLDGASKSITKVLASITTIANQTNLLALNATIEASRAGEAGRGFAVVAQEVKNLAAQTTRATAQIGDQIKDLQCAMATSQASILRVGEIIDSIEVGSLSISSAVQQHNGATHEIAISSTELALNNREVGVLVGVLQEDATETDTLAVRVALMCTELAEKVKGSEMTIRSLLSRIEAAA